MSRDTIMTNASFSYTCLDLRRDKLADPKRLSTLAQRHLAECEACQGFARRIDAMESRMSEALAIPVPDGLSDRIILRARRGRQLQWRVMALAASLLLAIAVTVQWTMHPFGPSSNTAEVAIEHVLHEPESFRDVNVTGPQEIDTILASYGGKLMAPIGKVMYVKLCPIQGHGVGWHIVFQTDHGMATLLLMPGDEGKKIIMASDKGLQALVRPIGPGHYYAVVTDSPTSLMEADAMLQKNVHWTAS